MAAAIGADLAGATVIVVETAGAPVVGTTVGGFIWAEGLSTRGGTEFVVAYFARQAIFGVPAGHRVWVRLLRLVIGSRGSVRVVGVVVRCGVVAIGCVDVDVGVFAIGVMVE